MGHPSEGYGKTVVFGTKRWDRIAASANGIRNTLSCRSRGGAVPGMEACPSIFSGSKVRGLHHYATTSSCSHPS